MFFSASELEEHGGGRGRITIRLSNNKCFTRLCGKVCTAHPLSQYSISTTPCHNFWDVQISAGEYMEAPANRAKKAKVNNRNIYHRPCVT